MSAHENSTGQTDEWYTPPEVFEALACDFDMDVASPGSHVVPWIPARHHLTEGGLEACWKGFVYMNAPFGKRNGLLPWARKFIEHGQGIALAPNRTAAPWMQELMAAAHGLLFWAPKIKFLKPDGTRGESPGYGTVFVAAGVYAAIMLRRLDGQNGVYCGRKL
ncbi:MAG: adenine methyltransferase [Pseudomonadota bacterium]